MLGLSNERKIYSDALKAEKKKNTYITEDMPEAESRRYEEQQQRDATSMSEIGKE